MSYTFKYQHFTTKIVESFTTPKHEEFCWIQQRCQQDLLQVWVYMYANLWTAEGFFTILSWITYLVHETLEESHVCHDKVDGRRADEHLTLMPDKVQAGLDKPVEEVINKVTLFLR